MHIRVIFRRIPKLLACKMGIIFWDTQSINIRVQLLFFLREQKKSTKMLGNGCEVRLI